MKVTILLEDTEAGLILKVEGAEDATEEEIENSYAAKLAIHFASLVRQFHEENGSEVIDMNKRTLN